MTVRDGVGPRDDNEYQPRRDVSSVPHQGGYAAKRCPLRVQYDVLAPDGDPIGPDDVTLRRMNEGNEFEADVFNTITTSGNCKLTQIPDGPYTTMVEHTVRAMRDGIDVILGGALPLDDVGRRTGKPDVLVRLATSDGTWGYLPVDVKHHSLLEPSETGTVMLSQLDNVDRTAAVTTAGFDVKSGASVQHDLLQLAHYRRMLEAAGWAATSGAGGIIGKERQVVWFDLNEPGMLQTWSRRNADRETALERYDFEFSYRLDVVAAALDGTPIVEPVKTSECDTCPWRGVCIPDLEERDCVSLLARVGYTEWKSLDQAGLSTRTELANLDATAVSLRDKAKGALVEWVDAAHTVPADTPVTEFVSGRGNFHKTLAAHRVQVASDLTGLPKRLVATAGRKPTNLLAHVQRARVHTFGAGHPHRLAGVDLVSVPTFDVEVDVDMENGFDGTIYLWGARTSDGYKPFVSWDQPGEATTAAVFAEFWGWLSELIDSNETAGRTVGVFCWGKSAESRALRQGAEALTSTGGPDLSEQVDALVGSGRFVDLRSVFARQLLVPGSESLKAIAPMAGHTWRTDGAGGEQSQMWHEMAVDPGCDPDTAGTVRAQIVGYNEDDTDATAAIRDWMRTETFASVNDLGL